MFETIKNIFKKEETFSCIVWDGKKMRYLELTKKEISSMEEKGYTVTLKDEC
jgi:hypothetical protein